MAKAIFLLLFGAVASASASGGAVASASAGCEWVRQARADGEAMVPITFALPYSNGTALTALWNDGNRKSILINLSLPPPPLSPLDNNTQQSLSVSRLLITVRCCLLTEHCLIPAARHLLSHVCSVLSLLVLRTMF
jgi:hypothetical protein